MDEDLDAARAEAFEYQRRAADQVDVVTARFQTAAERVKERVEAWKHDGPHTQDDGRIFRGMIRSISKLQANYLDAKTISSTSDTEHILERLSSDSAGAGADAKMESARSGRDRFIRRLNTVSQDLTPIMNEIERQIDELDVFVGARTISNSTGKNSSSELAPVTDNSEPGTEPPIHNPLSKLLLQLSDPANRKDFERTPEYREAGRKLLVLVQEIQGELDAQRLQLQSASERRHWRFEQWRSIGRHESDLEERMTSLLHEIKTLTDERNDWLRQWNTSMTNTFQEAAARVLSDPATRVSAAIQMYDGLLQLKKGQFPMSASLVSRIEAKSSEFVDYVDENLLKNPPKTLRRMWRR